jgi:ribosomal protein S18 acetylase RimI-like enzyme
MPCPEARRLAPPDAPLHRKLMLEAYAFSDKATLFGMYVRPAHREGGIGGLLVRSILRHARESGRVEVVQLTVSERNAGAIDLYARCGFVCFGTEPMAVKLGESYINKVHMWQRVAPDAP